MGRFVVASEKLEDSDEPGVPPWSEPNLLGDIGKEDSWL